MSGALAVGLLTGYFSFELVPDSATIAAGETARRYVTNGTFNVNISR